MASRNYFIKFDDFSERGAFLERVHGRRSIVESLAFTEDDLDPVLIVWNASDKMWEQLRGLAGSRARFFDDVEFDPMSVPSR